MNYFSVMPAFRLFVITMALFWIGTSIVCADDLSAKIIEASPVNALREGIIVVKRQGHTVDGAKMGTLLYSGDRILMADKQASLKILVSNQYPPEDITFKEAGKQGYVLQFESSSFLGNVKKILSDFGSLNPNLGTVSASTRKGKEVDELVIPADPRKASPKMAAGERALHFRWRGGKPPYQLIILKPGQEEIKSEIVSARAVSMPNRNWQPGEYQLVLSQSVGLPGGGQGVGEKKLIFVASADIPPMPQEIDELELRKDTRQLLYADWLARQPNGDWILEAIQRVVPLAQEGNIDAADWLQQWGGK